MHRYFHLIFVASVMRLDAHNQVKFERVMGYTFLQFQQLNICSLSFSTWSIFK